MGNACTTTDMTLSFNPVMAPEANVHSREGHAIICTRDQSLIIWGGAAGDPNAVATEETDTNIYLLKPASSHFDAIAPSAGKQGFQWHE